MCVPTDVVQARFPRQKNDKKHKINPSLIFAKPTKQRYIICAI